jgi:drug/metabolite transporter (DMT)-like permease
LILFGLVQVTMMAGALLLGERPTAAQWLGLSLAVVGLVYLMLPGIEAPPLSSALLMALAGFSWGLYSLSGRNAVDPLGETTGNFARSVLLVVGMTLVTLPGLHIEPAGVLLAVASGTLASGIGYVLWYAALRGLTATNAAVVQLSVPILAAAGGVAFLSEAITLRLALSALLILGGIAVAVLGRAPSHVEG